MTALLVSLGLVVLAEMGDKTQLLAMAFAARYRAATVLWGVFAATVFNHLLAVLAGNYLTHIIPVQQIQIAGAASFILFGLWTLRGDALQGEDKRFNYSPFWTVTVAFFIVEMGDKTQLVTVSLAAQYQSVFPVLIGTTAGMLIADAIGIAAGALLGKHLPERAVRWVAALIFLFFGLFGLYRYLPDDLLTVPGIVAALALVTLGVYIVGRRDVSKGRARPDQKGHNS